MKHVKKSRALPGLVLLLLFLSHCTADQLPEPQGAVGCEDQAAAFSTDIAPIMEKSCAYSGCHLDSAPGSYTSYAGLKKALDQGSFFQRVVTFQDDPNIGMPPDYAPTDRPRRLTEEELNLIRCWIEAGYPE